MFNEDEYLTGNGLTPNLTPARRAFSGFGYVVLNTEQDREEYIDCCHRTSTVTIFTTNGGDIVKKCIVPEKVWNQLIFPIDNDSRGSMVSWVNLWRQDTILILDVISKQAENNPRTEGLIIEERKTDNGAYSKIIDSYASKHITSLESFIEDGPEKRTTILHDQLEALYELYVQGDLNLISDVNILFKAAKLITLNIKDEENADTKNTTISYEMDKGFNYVDQFKNKIEINDTNLKITDKNDNILVTDDNGIVITDKSNNKITMKNGTIEINVANSGDIKLIGSGQEQTGVLAEKLKKSLDDLAEQLSDLCTQTIQIAAATPYPAAIPLIAAIKIKIVLIKLFFKDFYSKTVKLT